MSARLHSKFGIHSASRRWAAVIIAAMTAGLFASPAFAEIGDLLRLQGSIQSTGGGPIADGKYTLTVRFYEGKDDDKAKSLYTFVAPVAVKGGAFSATVGDTTKLDTKPFLSGKAAWIGVSIDTDPELPRIALHKAPYAIRADNASSASDLDCSGCVSAGELDKAVLAPYAKTAALSDYAKKDDLKPLLTADDLKPYVKEAALHAVAKNGEYGALKNKPVLLKASLCPSGEVVQGYKADGSAVCVKDAKGQSTGKDFALSNKTCPSGQVMKGVKSDGTPDCIADKDTTYGGKNFALSNKTCPSGQVMKGVKSDGNPDCATDKDTKYDGKSFALSNKTCGTGQLMKGIKSDGSPNCVADEKGLAIEWAYGWDKRKSASAGWTASSGWGEPRFSSSNAHTSTGSANQAGSETLDFSVPAGARTAYVSLLTWSNTGYFDVYLKTKSGSVWKFHRRIDQYQAVSNKSEGGTHDGNIVVTAATGLDHFSEVRLQNRKGRIHFTGIGFSRADMIGSNGTGFTHWDNVTHKPNVAYTSKIAADDFKQTEVNNLRGNKLANGTTPWVMAADDFNQTQVNNLRANKLANGTTPWAIAAAAFNSTEVNNLRAGKLDNGTEPWKSGSSHNHTYNVNDQWLRDNGDNAPVKLYGNSYQMVFRTDGAKEYAGGIGGYPFVWMYGGDSAAHRRMLVNTSGQLWTSNYGWLHDKFQAKGSYLATSGGTITGNLTVNGTFTANKGVIVDGKQVIDDGAGWHRAYGKTGFYLNDYGGGIHMTDSTWVRIYNNKNLLVNNLARIENGNGRVDIQPDSNASIELRSYKNGTPYIDFSNDASADYDARIRLTGNDYLVFEGTRVGVNTASPAYQFDVNGTFRAAQNAYFTKQIIVGDDVIVADDVLTNGDSRFGDGYVDRTRVAQWRRYNDSSNYTDYVHLDRLTVYTSNSKYKYTVPIDHTRLKDYCADYDGCQVVVGMYNWDNGAGSGNWAFHSYRWFYNASNGRWRNMDSGPWGGAQGRDKADGTQHSSSGWDACYFTDGVYVNGANTGDTGYGMNLLYWTQYGTGKQCRITLID